jgi:hypothetical protein
MLAEVFKDDKPLELDVWSGSGMGVCGDFSKMHRKSNVGKEFCSCERNTNLSRSVLLDTFI